MARKVLFEIEVENVGATQRINALREEIKRLNKEIKGINEGSDDYKRLTGEIANAQIEIKDLREQQKQLNRDFQAAKFPKDSLQGLRIEYAKLVDQIKILSAAERESDFGKSLIKNASGVKSQIDSIEQSLGRFTGNVGNYRSAFGSLAQIVSGGLIGGGIALTINSLTNSFTKGLSALQDYGQGLSRLSAITGVTGSALDDLEKRAQGLTTIKIGDSEIVNTAQQIFEAFTLVGSARPELLQDADALELVTKQAIILSKASGDDLDASVKAITSSLAQFQLGAKDSAEVINLLAAGSKVGKVEIPGLTDSITRLGPTAKNSNVSLAETVSIFETMADRGLEGERAAVSLRNVLVKLASAEVLPKQAQEAFKSVGIDIGVLSDKTIPLEGRLKELSKAAGNTTALVQIFGTENLDAASILADSVPKYSELLTAVQGTDEAYKQAGINADNAAQKFQNLEAQGVNLLTKAFLGAEPAISEVLGILSGLIGVLSEAPKFIAENADEVAALAFILLSFTKASQAAAESTIALTTIQGRQAAAMAISNAVTAAGEIVTKALSAAQAAMPLVALVLGIYAVAKAFEAYQNEASASEKATRAIAEAQAEIAKEAGKEVSALQRNIEVLKTENTSKADRKKAIDALVAAYPEYLKGIDLEKAGVSSLTALQDNLTKSIFRSAIARKQAQEDEKLVTQIIENQTRADRLRTEGRTEGEKIIRGFARGAQQSAEQEAQGLELVNKKLEEQRQIVKQRFERITPQEFVLVDPKAVKSAKDLGDASEAAGKKIEGLGKSTGTSKKDIDAQVGSVAALKEEVSKLQRQIDATNPSSPALTDLIQKLDTTKKKLKEAEQQLLATTFKSLFGRDLTAPTVDTPQPDLQVVPELAFKPDAKDQLIEDAKAAKKAVEDSLKAIEFPVEIKPISAEEKKFNEERDKAQEDIFKQQHEREQKAIDDKANTEQLIKESAISSAETVSNSVFEIQRNRLQQETDAKLAQLDIETQGQIAAAKGDEAKIKAIEKDSAAKRAAIEKEAARQRKAIAVKEAIINTALAITKALTGAPPPANLILAGVAAAAGLAQLAVIQSQEFAHGGIVKAENKRNKGDKVVVVVPAFSGGGTVDQIIEFDRNDVTERVAEFWNGGSIERLKTGKITTAQNAPRTAKGDTVLAYLAPGEMVLNQKQQNTLRGIFGQDAFALAGVPGESSTRSNRNIPAFASGGVVGIVPQNGFAKQPAAQPVTVDAKAEFSATQIDELGRNMGAIIAAEVSRQMRVGLAEGLFDANRRLEREDALTQNRKG